MFDVSWRKPQNKATTYHDQKILRTEVCLCSDSSGADSSDSQAIFSVNVRAILRWTLM